MLLLVFVTVIGLGLFGGLALIIKGIVDLASSIKMDGQQNQLTAQSVTTSDRHVAAGNESRVKRGMSFQNLMSRRSSGRL
jgi:hypothetical protein